MNIQSKILRWVAFGAIVAGLGYVGWHQKLEYDNAPYESAKQASQQEQVNKHEQMLVDRRDSGFVEKVNYSNAFGDVTESVVNVLGRTKGTVLTITRTGTGKLDSVCFSAITDDPKKELFAPYFPTSVYVKFDGKETKEFGASRGRNSYYLCVSSPQRFVFNMKHAKVMQVQLTFLDKYSKVPEVHEWNLTTYNDVVEK